MWLTRVEFLFPSYVQVYSIVWEELVSRFWSSVAVLFSWTISCLLLHNGSITWIILRCKGIPFFFFPQKNPKGGKSEAVSCCLMIALLCIGNQFKLLLLLTHKHGKKIILWLSNINVGVVGCFSFFFPSWYHSYLWKISVLETKVLLNYIYRNMGPWWRCVKETACF